MADATYVYCVVQRARRPSRRGAPAGIPDGSPPDVSGIGTGLWLVQSQVPLERYGSPHLETALRDVEWVSAAALGHQRVVEFFTRQSGSTVVPLKLCTLFSSLPLAEREITRQRETLQRVAKRLEGREEWGVRILRTVARGRIADTPAASGAAFLAARKAARESARGVSAAALTAAEEVFSTLVSLSAEHKRRSSSQAAGPAPLLEAAFLVSRRRRAPFQSAARRAATELASAGAALTMSGPWPAYSFVSEGDAP